jgi:exodeoxyribonuclease V beta subunit
VALAVVDEAEPGSERWHAPTGEPARSDLCVATLDRLPPRWGRRWSFSAIVDRASLGRLDPHDASMADQGADDEQEQAEAFDEFAAGPIRPADAEADEELPDSLLADLPAGTTFGTLVHSMLEDIDFRSDRLAAELEEAVDRQLRWRSVDLTPVIPTGATAEQGRTLLVDGLRRAIDTPLGAVSGGLRLADIGIGDRLVELSFDLRLADDGPFPSVQQIGAVMLDHLEPGDALSGWARRLAEGAIDVTLAGHLTGSIDLVMRVPGGPAGPRFVVADYKTNALHPRGQPVGPADYGRARLAAAMEEHDYPLQALLYSVALHRYLRWRMPDYRPDAHLGGIAYLFLRGMTGARAGADEPAGVFEWAVPPALVVSLSDLLDGRPPEGRAA